MPKSAFSWAGGNASPYSAAPLMGKEEEEAQSATNMRKRGKKIITGPAEIHFLCASNGGGESKKAEEETLMAPCLLSLPRGGGEGMPLMRLLEMEIKITQRAIH